MEHLCHLGVNVLSESNLLSGPKTGAGYWFIYLGTLWGLTVELISYPAPMANKQRHNARHWRPSPTDPQNARLLYSLL